MPFVPPWLDVSPSLFLQAGEKGADLGEEDKRIQLEAAQMAAQSGEANQRNQLAGAQLGLSRDEQLAANALKRDELQLSVQQQQQAQQQQAAALALKQQQMQQDYGLAQNDQDIKAAQVVLGNQLGQERAGTAEDRAKTYAEQAATALLRQQDLKKYQDEIASVRQQLADKVKPDNAVTVKTATGDTMKMTKEEYSAYERALAKWKASAAAATVPGRLWGSNPMPLSDYAAKNPEPQPQDFIGGAAPAAAALVQGKGTNAALTGATTAPTPKIPAAAIAYLQAHPDAAADFDAKYGEGMADTYVE